MRRGGVTGLVLKPPESPGRSVENPPPCRKELRWRLRIKTPSVEQLFGLLSGGNQQKVVLAKWLASNPQVLIVDEPTRGVDVGAKAEIYALMRELAREGFAILVISSDLPEVLTISDRILVMRASRLAGELSFDEASEERIMALAALETAERAAT